MLANPVDPRLLPFLKNSDLGLIDLRGCDLSGLNLSYVNLEGALLTGAVLRGTQLVGARLFGAQLMGADLSDANLMGANLSFAHLQRALLVRTNLYGAHLEHVDLTNTILEDAIVKNAVFSKISQEMFDFKPRQSWLVLPDGWCCRSYEWRAHLSEQNATRPPLIALHGMTGSGLDFQELAYNLDRPLLSFDLYGHGETLCCRVSEELSLDDSIWAPTPLLFSENVILTSRWLKELMKRQLLPEQEFELLGYSMGGRLALSLVEYWVREKDEELLRRLNRLTLIGASPGLEGDESEYAERRMKDRHWADRMSQEPLNEVLRDWDAQAILARLYQVKPELGQRLTSRRVQQSGIGLSYAMQAMSIANMPSLWDRLSSISVPTMWITGELDQKFTQIASRAAKLQGEQAHIHVIKKSGHSPHLERPDQVIACLQNEIPYASSSLMSK